MRLRLILLRSLVIAAISCLLPTTVFAAATTLDTASQRHASTALADFPTVDPNYIYDQLFSMVTRFQGREAGYDKPDATTDGHKGFADSWAKEMTHDLQGFGPQVLYDTFAVKGWLKRPATSPAYNVEVSVPGATHPEQVVVIGCHYDGEAVSTQSANDDGSGCAIELGVAKAMADYWRSHHTYPARTLRFVIFDAEEQGLLGSFHYLNSTINGDVSNIVAMFNEEQN
ncbi:MAG: M28 family peptidase, partial [Chloroflexi bacterium]|nr:M28 family peptidase [Chloroflexota bacterium]